MKEVILIGGTNDGTRVHTSDIQSPLQIAKRGQNAVSCDHRGINSLFETYNPVAIQAVGVLGVVFVEENLSPLQAVCMLAEGYRNV